MPAGDGSFSLRVCHSGMPMPMDSDRRRSEGHSHVDFCPFGALPGAGPIAHIAALVPASSPAAAINSEFSLRRAAARFDRANPARGPPVLA